MHATHTQDHARRQSRIYAEELRAYGYPEVGREIASAVPFQLSRPYVARTLAAAPDELRGPLLAEYRTYAADQGEQAANIWIRESIEQLFKGNALDLRASDADVRAQAQASADRIEKLLYSGVVRTETHVRALLLNTCDRLGIAHPKARTTHGMIARMTSPRWWRKALGRETMRRREEAAIRAGLVHASAGEYLSDASYRRISQKTRRDCEFLAAYEMVNESGDVLELAEVFEAGQSNPKHRFTEMMIRTRGIENTADELGWSGMFLTLTCPSRMHARIDKGGTPNPRYDGTAPKQAHDHLQSQWANVRGRLEYHGIEFMAVRVEEPHKDGTPHWHMIFFTSPRDERQALDLFREYYLERFDPDEAGARKHRIEAKRIDKAKGGAPAYLAKYIAKNIGGIEAGQQLDLQAEGLEPGAVLPRPAAWARVHGVRQFAFSGTAKVTLWRELRRCRVPPAETEFLPHWQAADSGDFARFMKAIAAAPLALWTEERQSASYPDETIRVIRGVERGDRRLETREHTWEKRRKAGFSAPWTRVNNCTGSDVAGPIFGSIKGESGGAIRHRCPPEEHPRRA